MNQQIKPMNKTKTLTVILTLIVLSVATVLPAPFSVDIPLRTIDFADCGTTFRGKTRTQSSYHMVYDSVFGGHWDVVGTRETFLGRATESFAGTVSDTTINGTFNLSNFQWTSDGYKACGYQPDDEEFAIDFTVTIQNGLVAGRASYQGF